MAPGLREKQVFSSINGDITRASQSKLAGNRQRAFSLLRVPVESLFATLFPGECRICREPLLNISRLPVCMACLDNMPAFHSAQCTICGELLVASTFAGISQGEQLCGLCQRFRPSYVRAAAYGPYEGVLRDLIHLLKYQRVRTAAKALGLKLADVLRAIATEAGTGAIVVPVPLYKAKQHSRGFNQTTSVTVYAVRALKNQFDLVFEADVLRRKRDTKSQTGLTLHQRRENVRGAFTVNPTLRRFIAGKNVILVDDVFTTGTTAEECSRVLLRAGAAKVWVATIARVSKLETMALLQHQISHPIDEEGIVAAAGTVARA
jgi:ComF family protein